MRKKILSLRCGVALTVSLFCAWEAGARAMSSNEVETAAVTWLRTSAVARSTVPGRSIRSMERRGGVWLLRLSASGYIVMSANDAASPIVAFSGRPFVEPEIGTAFHAILQGAATGLADLEDADESASTGVVHRASQTRIRSTAVSDGRAGQRKARWTALLGQGSPQTNSVRKVLKSESVSPSGVVVAPFLSTAWSQWQPYNDFSPVYAAEADGIYRGRSPCGCVATAAAQTMAYWKWPAHADWADVMTGSFESPVGGACDWLMRFSGRTPMQWTDLPTNDIGNACSAKGYELRGTVAESRRYPLARLMFLCGALGEMDFAEQGSSSSIRTLAAHAPWYESGRWVDPQTDFAGAVAAIRANLVDRIPVHVSVPGHAVVGCGWAEEAGDYFVYLNYGWGGSDDGYYNMDDFSSRKRITEACVGFQPRRMTQAKPMPRVIGNSARVEWSLPERYRNSTSGFTVAAERRAATSATLVDDFTTLSGRKTGCITRVADSAFGGGVWALKMAVTNDSCYVLPVACMLSSRSMLSVEVSSRWMLGHRAWIEMRTGEAWEKLVSVPLNDEAEFPGKRTVEVPLCAYGGKNARFRIVCDFLDGVYYSVGYACFANFKVTDAFAYSSDSAVRASGQARAADLTGLKSGTDYRILVTSDEMPACDADEIWTRTAGEAEVPVSGKATYTSGDLVYGASANADRWQVDGKSTGTTIVNTNLWQGGFTVSVPGRMASGTRLRFGWTAAGYYLKAECYDVVTVEFLDSAGGAATNLWSCKNSGDVETVQNVNISVGHLAGRSGMISVRYEHMGIQYDGDKYGVHFHAPQLTGVELLTLPSTIATERSVFSASGSVSIDSVESVNSSVAEGFFVESARGANVLRVRCPANVTSLEARSSLLSLIPDERISVTSLGSGTFEVAVDGSVVSAASDRSRMILTLTARDVNGTEASKDLVLRFSDETSPYAPGRIRFLSGGGTGTMEDQPIPSGSVLRLSPCRFANGKRRFAGWRCSNGRRYDDGCLVFNLAGANETVTMTAIWE